MKPVKAETFLHILLALSMAALLVVIAGAIREKVVKVGDSAPAFTIQADNGMAVGVPAFGGKVLVLNFWATWCPPCVEEMPSLNSFAQSFKDQGVVVLGVSVDRSEKNYRNFLRRLQLSFLTARDPEARISGDYGTFRYPETYVIDRRGKVVQKIIGKTDWADENMLRFIRSLL